ncbi:MAG: hypothetical protein U1F43_26930 [Myxococcota bacterium]
MFEPKVRVTGLAALVLGLTAPASARPPFPYQATFRLACERSELAAQDHDMVATTCVASADLARAGPATLVLEAAGSDASDAGPSGDFDLRAFAGTLGLDLNFGRAHGDFGVEVLLRMTILSLHGAGVDLVEPYPFAYGGLKIGVGWRWLELGGTPWPRPGDARMLHVGYGMDLYHWTLTFGAGLFGAPTLDPSTGDGLVVAPAFGSYGDVTGRFGPFTFGLRAVLGSYQSLAIVLGWQAQLYER